MSNNLTRNYSYISFHKPFGVLSQFTSEGGHPSLAGYDLPKGVYAAGRLDRDSEGLLLLSDDGKFIKQLLDPQFSHPRTYHVQVEGEPAQKDLEKMAVGLVIKGYTTKPCTAKKLDPQPDMHPRNPPIRYRQSIPTTWIEIILTEGKNRQVRRMTAAIGFPTLRLIRVSIGRLNLGELKEGEWKKVSKGDILLR